MDSAPTSSPSQQAPAELAALLSGPAGTPPPGTLSNFNDPPNLDSAIYASVALYMTSTSLAVLIRIYTRHFLLHSLGYDDYTSIVSWLALIGYEVSGLLAVKVGAGVHMWNVQLRVFFRLLYWINVTRITYSPAVLFVKLSILLQYSRIFNPIAKRDMPMFVAIRVCVWSIFLFHFVAFFFDIFECNPRERIWNKLITTGHCYNISALDKASGIFNVVSDFAILILPIPSIWSLQMSLRKKLLTTGVFAVGLFSCLASIIRSYYIWRTFESSDKSYLVARFGLWSGAELSIGIIVGCFPVMPKFFQHVGPKLSGAISFRSSDISKIAITQAFNRNKGPLDMNKTGASTPGPCHDPHTRVRGR